MENQQKFCQEEIFKKLLEIGNDQIKIIIKFAEIKGFKFENREQLKFFIKRNKAQAMILVGYSIEKIIETIKWLSVNADFKFTISSVAKYIDEDLAKLEISKLSKKDQEKEKAKKLREYYEQLERNQQG